MPKTLDVSEILVAPAGFSGLMCVECGDYLSWDEYNAIESEVTFRCFRGCGSSRQDFDTSVLLEDARFFDISEIRRVSWFHATTSSKWLESTLEAAEVNEDFMVHVGTLEAAQERRESIDKYLDHSFIYEVVLNDWATISEEVYEDQNDWRDAFEYGGFDVVRYLNRWEFPGSVSLLVRPSVLEMKGIIDE